MSCVWPFVVCLVNLVEVAVAELESIAGVRECVRCRSGGSSRMAWVVLCGGSVLALSFCRLFVCRLRSLALLVLRGLRCVCDVGVVCMRSIMSGWSIG